LYCCSFLWKILVDCCNFHVWSSILALAVAWISTTTIVGPVIFSCICGALLDKWFRTYCLLMRLNTECHFALWTQKLKMIVLFISMKIEPTNISEYK
jgi:hypothetical protein